VEVDITTAWKRGCSQFRSFLSVTLFGIPAAFPSNIEVIFAKQYNRKQNKIRQDTYLDSYETPPKHFQGTPEMARMHVDHCVESSRIAIMCHGDVTPLLIQHDPLNPLGDVADFSNHHKCRRYDKLLDWMKDHSMSCDGEAC
jgi:hypothetical protein